MQLNLDNYLLVMLFFSKKQGGKEVKDYIKRELRITERTTKKDKPQEDKGYNPLKKMDAVLRRLREAGDPSRLRRLR